MSSSPPFSLGPDDWKKIGKGAILAALGGVAAYVTASVLPTLTEHTANDLGALLVALAATALPIVANIVRKWLGDNTPPLKLLLMAAVFVLACGGTASAEPFNATAAAPGFIAGLFNDPLMMAAIMLGVSLFASKVLKIDLSAFILPLITSLLKPPGPPAVIPPIIPPVAPPVPTPNDPTALLTMLLNMLLQAKSSGDKEQEAATLKLLERFKTN